MQIKPPQRIYKSAFTDSTRWAAYEHRPGDIFICTPPKSGTTWMQNIVASLLWPDGNFPGLVIEIGPWFDGMVFDFAQMSARLQAQTHRRYLKTHTPADGLPVIDTARYIVVARDGRDAFMSFVNHIAHLQADRRERLNQQAAAQGLAPVIEFQGDIHQFFDRWLAEAEIMQHIATWWPLRSQPNVLFVHYNNLKADLDHEMQRVASFLEIDIPAGQWPEVVARCTFDRMRAEADKVGNFERILVGGAQAFLFQGRNGRWRDVLTDDELQRYQQRVAELLPPAAARWLEQGDRLENA